MIRDPSDGSVKTTVDHQPKPLEARVDRKEEPVLITTTSGLPLESSKAAYQEKLKRSREWLRQYRTNPEKVVREQGEQGE